MPGRPATRSACEHAAPPAPRLGYGRAEDPRGRATARTAAPRHYPVGSKVELVERLLERGVLHDETRAITKNRQPGRCCDAGCSTPGQAVMVALPPGRRQAD